MRSLEDDYRRYAELKNKMMKEQNSTELESLRVRYQELLAEVRTAGKGYGNILRLYSSMKRRGNESIDITDASDYHGEAEIVALLKAYGCDHFTFSSTCSNGALSAWKFLEAGAKLDGMMMIKSEECDFETEEYIEKPAYLFRI
mgnify:CR=1 FL=1